jgi:hypothetical protein
MRCRKVAEQLVDRQEKKIDSNYGETTHECRAVLRAISPAPPLSENSTLTRGHLLRKPTKHPCPSFPGPSSEMALVAEAG